MKPYTLFIALLAAALLCGCRQEERLRSGDLIFVGIPISYSLDDSSMDAAIAQATGTEGELNRIHVAIAEVDAEGTWIIDATIKRGVDRHPLDTFLTDFTLKDGSLPVFEVKRLDDRKLAEEAVRRTRQFLGQPYDIYFQADNGAMYCSELVQACYLDAAGAPIFPSVPMNFQDAEGQIPVYWTQLFGLLGEKVPQGEPGTNPQEMARDPHLSAVAVALP